MRILRILTKFGHHLVSHLSTDARFLQQVLLYFGSFDGPSFVEMNIYILPKATGVVVANRLGIPKSFMN